jgi:hypothetical protein
MSSCCVCVAVCFRVCAHTRAHVRRCMYNYAQNACTGTLAMSSPLNLDMVIYIHTDCAFRYKIVGGQYYHMHSSHLDDVSRLAEKSNRGILAITPESYGSF